LDILGGLHDQRILGEFGDDLGDILDGLLQQVVIGPFLSHEFPSVPEGFGLMEVVIRVEDLRSSEGFFDVRSQVGEPSRGFVVVLHLLEEGLDIGIESVDVSEAHKVSDDSGEVVPHGAGILASWGLRGRDGVHHVEGFLFEVIDEGEEGADGSMELGLCGKAAKGLSEALNNRSFLILIDGEVAVEDVVGDSANHGLDSLSGFLSGLSDISVNGGIHFLFQVLDNVGVLLLIFTLGDIFHKADHIQ
jgi:hypothetical protein